MCLAAAFPALMIACRSRLTLQAAEARTHRRHPIGFRSVGIRREVWETVCEAPQALGTAIQQG
ncbi:hypothetical protein LUTEI9C_150121 [Luteimonas sp. 9C]|nr:hypothetical protein LUTEI9C_150121 [Luteimonas sp. 9C]